MAKTESTAVNELIGLVQSGSSNATSEPGADLFATPKSAAVKPPRLTSPIPPMRGAGAVDPLPRARAPHSTSQHAMPAIPSPVRMSTAETSRGNTIPPISRPTQSTRSSGHSLPPPRTPRATSSQPSVRASSPQQLSARATVPSIPPQNAPVAAPFETRGDNAFAALPQQYPIIGRPHTIDATGDVIKADTWFDVSAAMHRVDEPSWDGTAVVPRTHRDTVSLVKKLIVPTVILAIVGVMVGGYFAFDGDGGKAAKKASAAPVALSAESQAVHKMAAVAPSAPAETAPADVAQPEPPTKAEELAKQEAATEEPKAEEPKSESMFPAATKAVVTGGAPAAVKVEAKGASETKIVAAAAAPAAAAPAPAAAKAEPAVAKPEPAKAEPAVAKPELAKPAPAIAKVETPVAPAPSEPAPIAAKSVKTSGGPGQIREVKTAKGVVKLVDIRIDSKPSGATVTLVDNGKTSFLGNTPLATSVDPARSYDVIFTYEGRPTQMAPLDPTKTSRLDVTLGRAHHSSSLAKKAAAPKLDSFVESKPAANTETKPAAKKTEKTKLAEPSFEEPKADKPEKKVAEKKAEPEKKVEKKAAEPAGEGTLMVSSKPPCEILIDGKATGLTTPQRSLPLSAGVHKVTFVNEVAGIKKTVSVSITADQSTKLIQDLMKK